MKNATYLLIIFLITLIIPPFTFLFFPLVPWVVDALELVVEAVDVLLVNVLVESVVVLVLRGVLEDVLWAVEESCCFVVVGVLIDSLGANDELVDADTVVDLIVVVTIGSFDAIDEVTDEVFISGVLGVVVGLVEVGIDVLVGIDRLVDVDEMVWEDVVAEFVVLAASVVLDEINVLVEVLVGDAVVGSLG